MLTIIICIIIGIVIDIKYNDLKWEYNTFLTVIIAGFIGCCLVVIIPSDKEIKTYHYDIVENNDTFLCRELTGGEMYYVFYYNGNDGIRIHRVKCDKVTIKYTNEAPIAIRYKEEDSDSFINWFFMGGEYTDNYVIWINK